MKRRPCLCGHPRYQHTARGCGNAESTNPDDPFVPGAEWIYCTCKAYTDAALPASGERPEFGRHRLPEAEAETAPAWPTLERFASAVWKQTVKRSGGR